MKFLNSFTFIFLIAIQGFSQEPIQAKWTVENSKNKSFVENLGQFDREETYATGKIKFAIDFGSTKIFFGEKGIAYNFLEIQKKSRDERAEIMNAGVKTFDEHKQKERLAGKFLVKSDQINMAWGQASESFQITGVHPTHDYHSYTYRDQNNLSKNINYVKGYEYIIYKNIYPNIDIKYEVHPIIGVKYAFILHAGADPSLIKMIYDRELSLKDGALHIPTLFGDIIDHAPITFYEDNKAKEIVSHYKLKNNQITFELSSYDNNQSIVIDPWVQTPVFPLNWDCVWELDTDAAGNVYIIGGVDPLQLKKYNSAGVLQWSYDTPYDTTQWLGTMATDDLGNSYVTNGTNYEILKVNTAGALVWSNTAPSGGQLSTEFWNIAFNCDQTKLIVGGTGGNLNIHGKIYEVNMANGNITTSVQVTATGSLFSIPPQIQEVRGLSAAPNGKYYFVTLDTIGYLNDNLSLCPSGSSSLYMKNHGVNWGYKSENWRYNNTGIKVIRADANFVYLNKGNELQKRSLINLSLIGSVTIPGGILSAPFLSDNVTENAGIDIDNCGNIYVGSKTGVYKFNSSLVQQAFYPTSFIVYDVRVSTAGDVIACGGNGTSSSTSRTGGVQSFAAGACAVIPITCCDATICMPQSLCDNSAPVTLTPAVTGGTWSGPGVSASGVFSPALVGPGTYTITYTLSCGSESIIIPVNSCTSILSACVEANGTISAVSGVPTYSWQNSVTTIPCISGLGTYCGIFTVAGTPVTAWSTFATGANIPAPVTWPVQLIDNLGTTVTYANLAAIPACIVNPCPTLQFSIPSQMNVLCYGAATGTATVSTSGGQAPYTYTWTPGGLVGATQSVLSAGTYVINILDANQCPGTTTLSITQPIAPLSVSLSTTPSNCGNNTGSATANPSGGTGPYTYLWSPIGGNSSVANNLVAGTYSVTITDFNACQTTGNAIVSTNGGPTLTIVSTQNVSCFNGTNGAAAVSATGGSGTLTYSWMPGSLTGATQNSLSAGSYTVTVTDANSCSSTVTLVITEPTSLMVTSSNILSANCGVNDGAATANASGGIGNYSYSWSPAGGNLATASNIPGGLYQVLVTDGNGCTSSLDVIVPSIGGPTVTVQSSTNVSCYGLSDGLASVLATGATAPYSYVWSPSGGNASNASNLSAGTYNVAVTDADGCVGTVSLTISSPAQIVVTESISNTNCTFSNGQISTTVMGGSGVYTYLWSNGQTTSSINNLSGGSYTLQVTSNSCSVTETYTVQSIGTLPITATPTTATVIEGTSVQLNAYGATSYTWTPTFGLSCTTCSNPIATPTSTTIYTVTGTDAFGCIGSADVMIIVETNCNDIFVPTVFAPSDGGPVENNTLCIFGNCIAELNYSVYNRWGELVFNTTDLSICWDGTYKDKPLNAGVFAYKLVVTLFDGTRILDSGNVTLVR
jgi:hypothetical protein